MGRKKKTTTESSDVEKKVEPTAVDAVEKQSETPTTESSDVEVEGSVRKFVVRKGYALFVFKKDGQTIDKRLPAGTNISLDITTPQYIEQKWKLEEVKK